MPGLPGCSMPTRVESSRHQPDAGDGPTGPVGEQSSKDAEYDADLPGPMGKLYTQAGDYEGQAGDIVDQLMETKPTTIAGVVALLLEWGDSPEHFDNAVEALRDIEQQQAEFRFIDRWRRGVPELPLRAKPLCKGEGRGGAAMSAEIIAFPDPIVVLKAKCDALDAECDHALDYGADDAADAISRRCVEIEDRIAALVPKSVAGA